MTLLDEPTISTLREFGGSLLAQLVDAFGTNAPQRIAQARAGLEAGDLDAVRRSCHSLKSTAATVGAFTLAETARRLEAAAAAGDTAALGELGAALELQCEQTIRQLRHYVGGLE